MAAVIFVAVNIFLSSVLFLDREWKNSSIIEHKTSDLVTRTLSLKGILEKIPISAYLEILSAWTDKSISGTGAALYGKDGTVLYENKTAFLFPAEEIKEKIKVALNGKTIISEKSEIAKSSRVLVLCPVAATGRETYVLLCSMNLKLIPGKADYLLVSSIISLFVSIVITLSVLLAFLKLFREPLREIEEISGRIAESTGLSEIYVPEKSFFRRTARHINKALKLIREKEENARWEKNERDAVFYAMSEGIIALDLKLNIIQTNEAAIKLLGISKSGEGRPLLEAVRNSEIHAFALEILEKETSIEKNFCIYAGGSDKTIKIRGNMLRDSINSASGLLLVLSDISQIMKLENMRSEFVANVSHEIKTPITAIKGSIETLLDGAAENPEESKKFMEIIERHTDRLLGLLDDLLSLSQVENSIEMEHHLTSIRGVLKNATELCGLKAESKNISLSVDCGENVSAEISLPSFEQALVNLLDNAIKYTSEGGAVSVSAMRENFLVKIRVTDNGCGISREHLPRLFERFYRVDKARSRKMGGTGLGLAIVKHIVHAHGGTVEVISEPGKGSTFTIIIPEKHHADVLKN